MIKFQTLAVRFSDADRSTEDQLTRGGETVIVRKDPAGFVCQRAMKDHQIFYAEMTSLGQITLSDWYYA